MDEFRRFIVYLATVQDGEVVETFKEALERHGLDLGGEIMTYAEELLAEGEARGRAEGLIEGEQRTKLEVVEGLLRIGVAWEVIEAAHRIDRGQLPGA